jgi:hypothetical protein
MIRASGARLRWTLLLAALAGAGWLAMFGDKTPPGGPTRLATAPTPRKAPPLDDASRPSARSPTARASQAAEPVVAIEALIPRPQLLPRRAQGHSGRTLFATPPPPPEPKAAAAPPPAPMAPPLPFRFIGKKLEGDVWEVFLARDEASFLARVGTVLDSNYRVEKIEPPSMVLIHLPTQQPQTLMIGDTL